MSSKRRVALRLAGAVLLLAVCLLPAARSFAAAPEISYVSRSADYGIPFLVMGENLDQVTEAWLWTPGADDPSELKKNAAAQPPALPVTPPAGAAKAVIVNRGNAHTLTIRGAEDNSYVSWSVSPRVLWLKSGQALSKPYMINKPDLYAATCARVVPGQMLSILGRDMGTASGAPAEGLVKYRSLSTGGLFWGKVLTTWSQNRPFRYQFIWDTAVPSDMPPGDYALSTHNLSGGPCAWSDEINVRVVDRLSLVETMARPLANMDKPVAYRFPGPWKEVRFDSAALSPDPTEFTRTLQTAIDGLSADVGGIITLPSGVYYIDSSVRIKPGVILRGAGRDATTIQVRPDMPLKGGAMLEMTSDTGLQDLAVIVGAGARIGVSARFGGADPKPAFINRTRIVNMQMLNGNNVPWGVAVEGRSVGFTMVGNDIVSGGNTLAARLPAGETNRHSCIQGNTFTGYPKHLCHTGISMYSLADSVVENNDVRDYTRGFVNQSGITRTWIAANVFSEIGGIGNGCEVILAESASPYNEKKVLGATAGDITLSDILVGKQTFKDHEIQDRRLEYHVYVLAGRGMGQWRRVVDNVGGTLKLEEPWNIVPDGGSTVCTIINVSRNLLLVNNKSINNAGSVVMSWDNQIETALVGNESHNSGPFFVYAGTSPVDVTNLHLYNYYSDNRQMNSGGMDISSGKNRNFIYGRGPAFDNGNMFGNVYLRNQVYNPIIAYSLNQYGNIWDYKYEAEAALTVRNTDHNIFAGNYIYNANNGIAVENSVGNVFFANKMEKLSGERLTLLDSRKTWAQPFRDEPAYKPRLLALPPLPVRDTVFTFPGAVPASEVNVAAGKPVSSSFPERGSSLAVMTDGEVSTKAHLGSSIPGAQYIQVDLGKVCNLSRIRLWNYYADGRNYRNVIVQLSGTPEFGGQVVTLFNNDADGSSGQGKGKQPEYYENENGLDLRFKTVPARYIRCWLDGNSSNMHNHWVELMAFEAVK